MARHIAIVEDDTELRKNYTEALQREGYAVSAYKNRPEAEEAFADRLPDLAILDIMLEDERDGGFTLCSFLRAKSDKIPIIFLTALNSDIDRVSAMRLGATDYLFKDTTTLDYLPVRISSLFRYLDAFSKPVAQESNLMRGPLTLNKDRMEVTWDNKPVRLTLTEFSILLALIKRPGNLKSHGQLMQAANTNVTDNAIAASVRRIREKFKETDPGFSCIQTEYGMGYRWVE
ncbi:MAG: chemotaxis protein CheY [Desulfobacterales bacterium SG8_35]|nr:MAG: chemotaxis protein CheY [Desulfobacterales bacterium SG8_35]